MANLMAAAMLLFCCYLTVPSLGCNTFSLPTPLPPVPFDSSSTPCPQSPSPPAQPQLGSCPVDSLKLGACVDVLGGLVHLVIGQSTTDACCPLLAGVAGIDAALCLCTAIRLKLLNVNVVLPLALQLLVDCGKRVPSDYQCAS